jgi:mRNA interferase MazF
VVARNEIYWANLEPPAGRRPVVVLSRTAVIPVLHNVTCAAVTRRIRGIASEVEVGREEGLPHPGVINCDAIMAVPKEALDEDPLGQLGAVKRAELDRALRFSLGIRY